jgi:hypothetical protein
VHLGAVVRGDLGRAVLRVVDDHDLVDDPPLAQGHEDLEDRADRGGLVPGREADGHGERPLGQRRGGERGVVIRAQSGP